MRNLRIVSALAAGAIAAACAAATQNQTGDASSAPGGRDCFNVRNVSGFNPQQGNVVRISAGPSRDYDLELRGPSCDRVQWSDRVAIEGHPSSWICVGDGPSSGELRFRDLGDSVPTTCLITSVRRAPQTP